MLGDELLQPPVTAPRIDAQPFTPSARALGPDCYELTTLSQDSAEMLRELAELGIAVPPGTVPRLVDAKHDPAAWMRATAFTYKDDGTQVKTPATTVAVIRRRWVFDWSAPVAEVQHLVEWVLKRKVRKPAVSAGNGIDAFVVALADLQIGKVDVHGGSDALLNALSEKFDAANRLARGHRPRKIILGDLGDCIENFDNTVVQAYTNDLTLADQVDVYNALTLRLCIELADIAPVEFLAVPSNHTQMRRGGSKGSAWKPSDDYAILNARMLARTLTTAGRDDITVIIPETYAESLSLDVAGLPIAFAHGHQVARPENIPVWWQKQAFGSMPTAQAKVLITGHFHHFRAQQLGDRLWLSCPAMDGGSAWFSNVSGQDSPRGLLTFTVNDLRLDNLRIL